MLAGCHPNIKTVNCKLYPSHEITVAQAKDIAYNLTVDPEEHILSLIISYWLCPLVSLHYYY